MLKIFICFLLIIPSLVFAQPKLEIFETDTFSIEVPKTLTLNYFKEEKCAIPSEIWSYRTSHIQEGEAVLIHVEYIKFLNPFRVDQNPQQIINDVMYTIIQKIRSVKTIVPFLPLSKRQLSFTEAVGGEGVDLEFTTRFFHKTRVVVNKPSVWLLVLSSSLDSKSVDLLREIFKTFTIKNYHNLS